ncbi:PadR family transcriptional regulator [Acetobacterium paludosum]|uniref:PadR family transcriptional regulator n=1 Tax=Acetobacterium paludosum TaxID=52693 RepID=A0A923HVI5_9FIRM|nr:PadR family transcriptional regulator [Acetobacterium paludosum]MBC3889313.1 PadR family transcriptional regulator [Acetobacterium paludosum]
MRTLKYAILGLLNKKPMTGYDIGKEFNNKDLAEFWTAKHSQIYPELKKLLDEELIVYQIEISGEILEKKRYSITEKGKEAFLNWLKKDEPMEPTPKDIFRLRMYFSNNLDGATRLYLLDRQLIQHRDRLAHLNKNKERYDDIPPLESEEFGDYLVLSGAISREEATIQWLENFIAYCKNQDRNLSSL